MSRSMARRGAALLVAAATLLVPSAAFADDLTNQLDDSGDAALETLDLVVPTSGGTTVFLEKKSNDGDPACNLDSATESVTFSIASSDPAVATVSPSSITFDGASDNGRSCNEIKAITVTPVAAGTATITFTQTANSAGGTFSTTAAAFSVNVTDPVVDTNDPPSVGDIAGSATVDEGTTGTYGVTATDPDGDALTYAWEITGGNATIDGSSTGSSVSVDFTDGPSTVGLRVTVSDGTAPAVTRTLSITENNVAPVVAITSGAGSASEGDTATYAYTVTDVPADTVTITESCSAPATKTDTPATGSFDCTFPDDGTYTAGVSAQDDDGGTDADTTTVAVANVAPSITGFTVSPTTGTACLGGTPVRVQFAVSDPATETYDPITGTVFGSPFSGRSYDGSVLVPGTGTTAVGATANDGDGGSDSESVSVTFSYSTAGGFPLPPINADGTNNFKNGSTIPVKLKVLDCAGRPVPNLAPQVKLVKTTSSTSGTVNEEATTVSVPDENATMRYSADGQQYVYNLSTKRSYFATPVNSALTNGRYVLTVSAPEFGTAGPVGFDLVK